MILKNECTCQSVWQIYTHNGSVLSTGRFDIFYCLYITQTFPTALCDISHFFAALVKCLADCQDHIIGNIQGFFFGTLRSVYIKSDTTKWHKQAQYFFAPQLFSLPNVWNINVSVIETIANLTRQENCSWIISEINFFFSSKEKVCVYCWCKYAVNFSLTLNACGSMPEDKILFFPKSIHSRLGMPLNAPAGMVLISLPVIS